MKLLLLCLFIFSGDLDPADFKFTATQIYRSVGSWDLMIDEMKPVTKSKPKQLIFDNYAEVYDLCKAEGRKLTVVKNVENLEPFVGFAIRRGDYVYIAKGDDERFPDGVTRYDPNLPAQPYNSFVPSFSSVGTC